MLFQRGQFKLHSGAQSDFRIECDALDDEDIETLAYLITRRVKSFKHVIGVPKGGLKLAKALKKYTINNPELPILIVDDVLTTGESLIEALIEVSKKASGQAIGAVVFARGSCPEWVTPIFQMEVKDG